MMAITDGIMACYSPSVCGGGYLLPDLTVRGNHGVLTNMDAATSWTASSVRGISGRTLSYDGTNDFVNCGQRGGNLTNAVPFAVSVWAYARAFSTYAGLVSRDQGAPYAFAVRVGGGIPSILTDGVSVSSASTVATQAWLHYCVVLLPSRRLFYVNGNAVIDSTATYTITANSEPLSIGTDFLPASDRCWNGQIGETTIFNRAVTQAEVVEIVRRGNGAIGRMLTGQSRRRTYGKAAGFRPYWARQRAGIIGGGVR